MFDVLVGGRAWTLCARFLMSCNGKTEISKYLYSIVLPKFKRYFFVVLPIPALRLFTELFLNTLIMT